MLLCLSGNKRTSIGPDGVSNNSQTFNIHGSNDHPITNQSFEYLQKNFLHKVGQCYKIFTRI